MAVYDNFYLGERINPGVMESFKPIFDERDKMIDDYTTRQDSLDQGISKLYQSTDPSDWKYLDKQKEAINKSLSKSIEGYAKPDAVGLGSINDILPNVKQQARQFAQDPRLGIMVKNKEMLDKTNQELAKDPTLFRLDDGFAGSVNKDGSVNQYQPKLLSAQGILEKKQSIVDGLAERGNAITVTKEKPNADGTKTLTRNQYTITQTNGVYFIKNKNGDIFDVRSADPGVLDELANQYLSTPEGQREMMIREKYANFDNTKPQPANKNTIKELIKQDFFDVLKGRAQYQGSTQELDRQTLMPANTEQKVKSETDLNGIVDSNPVAALPSANVDSKGNTLSYLNRADKLAFDLNNTQAALRSAKLLDRDKYQDAVNDQLEELSGYNTLIKNGIRDKKIDLDGFVSEIKDSFKLSWEEQTDGSEESVKKIKESEENIKKVKNLKVDFLSFINPDSTNQGKQTLINKYQTTKGNVLLNLYKKFTEDGFFTDSYNQSLIKDNDRILEKTNILSVTPDKPTDPDSKNLLDVQLGKDGNISKQIKTGSILYYDNEDTWSSDPGWKSTKDLKFKEIKEINMTTGSADFAVSYLNEEGIEKLAFLKYPVDSDIDIRKTLRKTQGAVARNILTGGLRYKDEEALLGASAKILELYNNNILTSLPTLENMKDTNMILKINRTDGERVLSDPMKIKIIKNNNSNALQIYKQGPNGTWIGEEKNDPYTKVTSTQALIRELAKLSVATD
jgi:hypothetical protein